MDAESEEIGIPQDYMEAAERLASVARAFVRRGWAAADCGSLSLLVRAEPFCLAITPQESLRDSLSAQDIRYVDSWGNTIGSTAPEPSADLALHLELLKATQMKAIVHTHSLWSLLAAELFLAQGGVALEGYDCLGNLRGSAGRAHREWIPTVNRVEEIEGQLEALRDSVKENPEGHAVLLPGLGLYCWGRDLEEAKSHAEIFEFLLELRGRFYSSSSSVRPVFLRRDQWQSGRWSFGRIAAPSELSENSKEADDQRSEELRPPLRLVQGRSS